MFIFKKNVYILINENTNLQGINWILNNATMWVLSGQHNKNSAQLLIFHEDNKYV